MSLKAEVILGELLSEQEVEVGEDTYRYIRPNGAGLTPGIYKRTSEKRWRKVDLGMDAFIATCESVPDHSLYMIAKHKALAGNGELPRYVYQVTNDD